MRAREASGLTSFLSRGPVGDSAYGTLAAAAAIVGGIALARSGPVAFAPMLAAFAGAALLPFFVRRIDVLLTLVVAVFPLGILGRVGGSSAIFNSFVQLAGAYLAAVWLVSLVFVRGGRLLLRPFVGPVTLLFLVMMCASVIGHDWDESQRVLLRYYAPFLVFILIFQDIVRTASQLRMVCWAVVASFAGVSALSVLVALGLVPNPGLLVVDVGLAGGIMAQRLGTVAGGTATASFQSIFAAGIAVNLAFGEPRLRRRVLTFVALLLIAWANFQTATLAGFLTMSAVVGLSVLLAGAHKRRHMLSVPRLAAAALVFATLTASVVSLFPVIRDRATERLYNEIVELPYWWWLGGRVGQWIQGVNVMLDNPFGVGLGNVGFVLAPYMERYPDLLSIFPQKFEDALYMEPHNTYLTLGIEGGVLALVLFLGIVAAALMRAGRALRLAYAAGRPRLATLGQGIGLGTLGILVFSFTSDQATSKELWLALAMVLVYSRVARTELGPREATASRSPIPSS